MDCSNKCSCETDKNAIYKGDDTGAFGQEFLWITTDIPEGWVISKAEFIVENAFTKTFTEPTFPIKVNLTSAETKKLSQVSKGYLKLYDNDNLKQTLEGHVTLHSRKEIL